MDPLGILARLLVVWALRPPLPGGRTWAGGGGAPPGGLEGAVVKVEVRAGGRRQTVFVLPLAHLLWEGA